jgi:hypothetical protein
MAWETVTSTPQARWRLVAAMGRRRGRGDGYRRVRNAPRRPRRPDGYVRVRPPRDGFVRVPGRTPPWQQVVEALRGGPSRIVPPDLSAIQAVPDMSGIDPYLASLRPPIQPQAVPDMSSIQQFLVQALLQAAARRRTPYVE